MVSNEQEVSAACCQICRKWPLHVPNEQDVVCICTYLYIFFLEGTVPLFTGCKIVVMEREIVECSVEILYR